MFGPRLTGNSISKAPKLLKVSAGTQMRHFQLVGLKQLVWALQAERRRGGQAASDPRRAALRGWNAFYTPAGLQTESTQLSDGA